MDFQLVTGGAKGPRLGRVTTRHGSFDTPVFMPVGTQASVKACTPLQVKETGASIILANTYHLYLRPGHLVVERLGGLHKFMGWDGPILIDSGGFQVFSLASLRDVSDQGVTFRSHIDGSLHFIGPSDSMEIQHALGADIIMCFDECIAYPASQEEAGRAAERTLRWARACLEAHSGRDQALFGIVQGSVHQRERVHSAESLVELGFPGYAIGGLSVGEPKEDMYRALSWSTDVLPEERPRYLMGVGAPEDIIEGVRRGVDMFDCVLPTRIARHGAALTAGGRVLLKTAAMSSDETPIEDGCSCYTCRNFTRAYIRHLFKAGEPLALTLSTIHNLAFMARFMDNTRRAVAEDRFEEFARAFKGAYSRLASKRNAE